VPWGAHEVSVLCWPLVVVGECRCASGIRMYACTEYTSSFPPPRNHPMDYDYSSAVSMHVILPARYSSTKVSIAPGKVVHSSVFIYIPYSALAVERSSSYSRLKINLDLLFVATPSLIPIPIPIPVPSPFSSPLSTSAHHVAPFKTHCFVRPWILAQPQALPAGEGPLRSPRLSHRVSLPALLRC
jgi:hypothetical protein